MRQTRNRSILLMVFCSILWSVGGLFIKLIPWNPFVIAGSRSLVAVGIVALYMKAAHMRFRLNRDSLVSGVMLSLTFLAFVTANKLTTSANAIVLQFTAPVFIVLISAVAFKQRFRRADIAVVVVTMLGISLCFFDQLEAGGMLGNGVALLSGVFFAGMYVSTGRADSESRMSGILLGQLFTAMLGIPIAAVYPTPFSWQAILYVVILGIFQLGIPYILYAVAVGGCPPLACSLIGAVEPLLNPIWVFLFYHEAPGVFSLFGGAVVIGVITAWCIWGNRQEAAPRT